MTDRVHHLTGVVDRAVIGSQLNHRQAEGTLMFGFFRSNFTHQATQILFIKAMRINAADKAIRVSSRFKVNRRRTGLKKSTVMIRFVIIAVKEHQIARCQHGI